MVKLTDKQLLIVAGAGLLLAWYAANRVKAAAVAVAPLVNPFDERNLASTGTNRLLGGIFGVKDFSLGTAVYDVTHDGTLNPASTNNVVYRNLGTETDTLGTKVYDGVQWVKGLWK